MVSINKMLSTALVFAGLVAEQQPGHVFRRGLQVRGDEGLVVVAQQPRVLRRVLS